jgi:hypothetical protein
LYANRVVPGFKSPGVVQNQDCAAVAQPADQVLPHVIADLVGFPDRLTQQPLHPFQPKVPGLLGQLPT